MKIGLIGALGLIFVVLKLTHVIAWSWFWVTIPLWGGTALILGGAVVFVSVAMTVDSIKMRGNRKRAALRREEYRKQMESGRG